MAKINPDTRLISGSEIAAYQKCQMRWWFEHRIHKAPKRIGDGLFRGIVGHEALSNYYRAVMAGGSREDGEQKMFEFVAREIEKATQQMLTGYIPAEWAAERFALITWVQELLREYLNFYAEKDFQRYEVVEVEHMHVGPKFSALRLDLLLRDLATGELVLMDHKFLDNFYGQNQLIMNSQLPRYMRVLIGDREETVSYGLLNQIRTRKDAVERFVRTRIDYNDEVARRRTRDQEKVSSRIRKLYHLSPLDALQEVERTSDDYACKYCPFPKPCSMELRGDMDNFGLELQDRFEESSYGYNKAHNASN